MKTPQEVVAAIDLCSMSLQGEPPCEGCPYFGEYQCRTKLMDDVKNYIIYGHCGDDSEQKPVKSYWSNITEINERQEQKGRSKYGEDLEDNTTLTTNQRIEHAQEEAIDLLKYLEHLKQVTNDGITANDYQRAALRTAWPETKKDLTPMVKVLLESGAVNESQLLLLNGVLGLAGESGEAADLVKKNIFQGHRLDLNELMEELGDVAWYLAIASHAIGYNLGDIFQGNVDKLKNRYPDGFDKSRSINREDKP